MALRESIRRAASSLMFLGAMGAGAVGCSAEVIAEGDPGTAAHALRTERLEVSVIANGLGTCVTQYGTDEATPPFGEPVRVHAVRLRSDDEIDEAHVFITTAPTPCADNDGEPLISNIGGMEVDRYVFDSNLVLDVGDGVKLFATRKPCAASACYEDSTAELELDVKPL